MGTSFEKRTEWHAPAHGSDAGTDLGYFRGPGLNDHAMARVTQGFLVLEQRSPMFRAMADVKDHCRAMVGRDAASVK